jgi:tRNA(Ile)-lysidine synthase TilS/MesJ
MLYRATGFINQRKRHWHKVRRAARVLACALRYMLTRVACFSCSWTARRRLQRRRTRCVLLPATQQQPPLTRHLRRTQGLLRAYGSLTAALAAAQRA